MTFGWMVAGIYQAYRMWGFHSSGYQELYGLGTSKSHWMSLNSIDVLVDYTVVVIKSYIFWAHNTV
jgi:hypothetical protein